MKSLCIIYIPGLGNGDYLAQRKIVHWWHFLGVETELFPINWNDQKPWSSKRDALLVRVDALAAQGKRVALVGISAGGSAAINIYAARKNVITGIVCIAGWINYPEDINPIHLKINPAFVASAGQTAASLETLKGTYSRRILSLYALSDRIVNRRHSIIPGACNRSVLSIGHGFTIATQIVLGAPGFIRFL
ncbi:MAG TPA: hypothetical protein VN778_01830, partial [Verrucomicrobiae bacterium]|nr:hypothetical protein [Verrucomicrobiae bacterium]